MLAPTRASASAQATDVPRRKKGAAGADPARTVALDVMAAARERDSFVNLLLPVLLHQGGLGGRDAAFATELAHGTIRMQGCYDAILAAVVDRPLHELEPTVLDVLRLGSHQLLSMRTPAHAAVSTSVDLARARTGTRAVSFVNAVLRRVSGRDLTDWTDEVAPSPSDDPLGHLAVVHSHPMWIVRALHDALGGDVTETARMLAADNAPARVTLAARPGLSDRSELLSDGANAGSLSPYAVRLRAGSPADLAAVREGRAGVQDEGSQVVAIAAAAAPLAGPDARWLDLCAGPGGKTALLAAIGSTRGARVVGNEVAPHRARMVAQAVRRLPAAGVLVGDGRAPAWRDDCFDRVLVDAPCTGLGALRRRPEARWRHTAAELPGLVTLQRDLLAAAVDSVRPGGVVAYATCSPHGAETTEVVESVRSQRGDVELLDATAVCPHVPAQRGPFLQLWPHVHGTDAMFLALLRKR